MAELVQANLRLHAADLVELKRRAAVRGVHWQTLLRKLVREALRERDPHVQ